MYFIFFYIYNSHSLFDGFIFIFDESISPIVGGKGVVEEKIIFCIL